MKKTIFQCKKLFCKTHNCNFKINLKEFVFMKYHLASRERERQRQRESERVSERERDIERN